jgi:NAD(P)-dependent dehydrogenase (short-subunit alcohol dehydrogenase family)
MVDYRDQHVVVTGGTGALGTAVVAALIEAGATCHVPWLHEDEAQRFAYRAHKQVRLVGSIDLTDEAAVGRLFGDVPALWASIHTAGGFSMGPVAKSHKADLMKQLDIDMRVCVTLLLLKDRGWRGGRLSRRLSRPWRPDWE